MTVKRATEDIYAAPGVLAFRKGDVVPDGNSLATPENTAGEGTKAAKAAVADAADEQTLAEKAAESISKK